MTRLALLAAWSLVTVASAAAGPAAAEAVEITGATRVEYDEASGTWQLRGDPVVVRRGAVVVRAPVVVYESRERVLRASGGAAYEDAALSLTSHGLTAWLREARAVAEGEVAAHLRGQDPPTRIRAGRLELRQAERTARASGGVVLLRGEITLRGEQLDYDDRTRSAVATGRPSAEAQGARLTADRLEALLEREEVAADGDVALARGDIEGRAPRALLRVRERTAVLSGGAEVRQGPHTARAAVITVELGRSRIVASGQATVVVYPGR